MSPKGMLFQDPLTIGSGQKYSFIQKTLRYACIRVFLESLVSRVSTRDVKEMNFHFYCVCGIWASKLSALAERRRVGPNIRISEGSNTILCSRSTVSSTPT